MDAEEGVNKKCRFYGKRNFNVIYGAILHYDQCSFGSPRRSDMVLGLEMTSLYLSCGLCHSIRPQSTRKSASVRNAEFTENIVLLHKTPIDAEEGRQYM
eukprot:scaffold53486_cov75-Attheya_sp.AAC.1